MQNKTSKIPVQGSMTEPDSIDEALQELKDGLLQWQGGCIDITYQTDELTSVCPSTGQPDFSSISIRYVPKKVYIESKRMKFYLWAFRNKGYHCESLADKVARDLFKVTQCAEIEVVVNQNPRGGLALISKSKLSENAR